MGFDCADIDLVAKWSSEGRMPTCVGLEQQGTFRRLRTTSEIMHVAAWPSLYTGTSPGHHGISHAYFMHAGEQRIRKAYPMEFGRPPFWKHLDDAGRKCIVFDAFASCHVEDFHGIQVNEYGTWTWFSDPRSTPSPLLRELKRQYGPYPAPEHSRLLHVPHDLHAYRDELVAGARLKGRIMHDLLRDQPWDMAFIGFGEAHAGGHYLWHAGDSEYPLRPTCRAGGTEHLLRDVYSAIDAAIGELLQSVDDATTVIVISVDGMGPNYSATHFMPEVLHRLGLFYSNTVRQGGTRDTARLPRRTMLRRIREAIPMSARQSVTRRMPRCMQHWLELKWLNSGIDWARSKVIPIPSSNEAYFRVNLVGREPGGIVRGGSEYEELTEQLQRELASLVNPLNSRHICEKLPSVDALCAGPLRSNLPDVVAKWDPGARVTRSIESAACGRIDAHSSYETSPFYTGEHRNVAFALSRGPSIPANTRLDAGHILDVAPTILDLLGVERPRDMEGHVWP